MLLRVTGVVSGDPYEVKYAPQGDGDGWIPAIALNDKKKTRE